MDSRNLVDIHVVIHDYNPSEDDITSVSGNTFAILSTCASIFYNVGNNLGLSVDGMKKMFNEKIDKLVEFDRMKGYTGDCP